MAKRLYLLIRELLRGEQLLQGVAVLLNFVLHFHSVSEADRTQNQIASATRVVVAFGVPGFHESLDIFIEHLELLPLQNIQHLFGIDSAHPTLTLNVAIHWEDLDIAGVFQL